MEQIKPAAVAGRFYPEESDVLRKQVNTFLENGYSSTICPKAIIAPHAGYEFSGPVAGSAYRVLSQFEKDIRRVVLLGPSHFYPLEGCAVPSVSAFSTPLGHIKLDREAIDSLNEHRSVSVIDEAFEKEHSLEVQLPFLQASLNEIKLVPILVGRTHNICVARLLAEVWAGKETLIVVSSDLSHYLDFDKCREKDLVTTDAITSLQSKKLDPHAVCGRFAVAGLLYFARMLGYNMRAIDLRNSGDTSGDKQRVVGYGAYHLYADNEYEGLYDPTQKTILYEIARKSIMQGINSGSPPKVDTERLPFSPDLKRATFVTLEQNGKLRGCIGSLSPEYHIASDVARNAYRAAFNDKRFKPLTKEELAHTTIHISVLSDFKPMHFSDENSLLEQLRPGIDGLLIHDQGHQAIFLPMVWKQIPNPAIFLKRLKRKAGMSEDHWSDKFQVFRFTAGVLV